MTGREAGLSLVISDSLPRWSPAGLSPGTLLFVAYVSPSDELIESFSVRYHQLADGLQLLLI